MKLPASLMVALEGYSATRISGGESGARVYRFSRKHHRSLYLKRGSGRIARDILDEAARLAWLNQHLPSPKIRQLYFDGTAAWLLTTALPGRSAEERLPDASEEDRPAIVRSIAEFLRRLHAIPADACPFDSRHTLRMRLARQNIDAGLVDESDFDESRQGWTAEQVWAKLSGFPARHFEEVVTHGDFSLGNIFLEGTRVTGVLDTGRLGIADPYQDLAILWNNLTEFGQDFPKVLLEAYGSPRPDKRRLEFHLCLGELF